MVTGKRTTARSLTQFFAQIESIEDLRGSVELVSILAESSLDDVTVATFLSFVNDNLQELINPEDILAAEEFEPVSKRIAKLAKGTGDAKRVDRLATICTRMYLCLAHKDYTPGKLHSRNLVEFLLHDDLPRDLRFSLHKDILAIGPERAELVREPRLAKLVLQGM